MGWQSFFPKVLLCEFLLSLLLKLRMRHVTLGWERANPAFPWLVTRHFPLGSAPSQPSSLALHPASGTGTEPTLPLYPLHPPQGSPLAPPTPSRGAPGTGHAFGCSADFASAGPGLGVGVAGTRASYLLPACFLLPVTLQGSSWGPVRTRCSDSGADYLVGGWAWTAESAAEIILTLLLSGSG